MRKLFLIFLICTLLCSELVAQESTKEDEIAERIWLLLDDGVLRNNEKIYELSSSLSEEKRNELYTEFEQSKSKAIGLNLLGFGIGSFLEQDSFGGYTQLAASIVGWSAIIGGYTFVLQANENSDVGYDYNGYSWSSSNGKTYHDKEIKHPVATGLGWSLIAVGVCSLTANMIFKIARPCVYTKKYNRTLKSSLRATVETDSAGNESIFSRAYRFIQEKRPQSNAETGTEPIEESAESTEMSFSPIINPIDQSYGFSLRFALPTARN